MSHRASGIVLLVLSFPLLMLGITSWQEAAREADVRAWQLRQSVSEPDPQDREDFARYAESTLDRQVSAEKNRNWMLAIAVMGIGAGVVLLLPRRRRAVTELVSASVAGNAAPSPPPSAAAPQFRPCRACQWQISVEAVACPRCGCPHVPLTPAAPPSAMPSSAVQSSAVQANAEPPRPINKLQRAFYVTLMVLGLGSAVVIYTVMFNSLSETVLVQISPYWIFPTVFGYYGLVAQRMEAKLQTTHLDTVSDQLLNVIKELGGPLGQVFAFLVHAPFLIVKSRTPWVTAFVGSLIWAMALVFFFAVIFPEL
ncbi:hypothetical protein Rhe02_23150 [Rhizocola hellebori]|uniref:Uncharacterized protein n=1 Tax=Rhizocola hellebori TaxID=1392758 RepID=A0A8J3Q598_9ACTN|nr:hypothetical protein [Rhizocola hellebori]GIH04248.1 hypothetical protein Rhe02_23150 [Rhizocola hellebori]